MIAKTQLDLEACGLVAVIRAASPEEALTICQACADGGIKALEITFTIPRADEVLRDVCRTFEGTDVLVGAGTVLDSEACRIALLCGAQYIVAPNFSRQVAETAHRYAVPYIPGIMTVDSAVEALEAGCELVKLFPASVLGIAGMKAFKGPLPQLRFMATGGIGAHNAAEWIRGGAAAVGVGGELTRGTPEEICRKAAQLVTAVTEAKHG